MKDDMKAAPGNGPENTHPNAETGAPEPAQKNPVEDPIGDVTDGEARAALDAGSEADLDAEAEARIDTYESEGGPEPQLGEDEVDKENAEVRPPAKLERLQKILSQAGIASRRKAEELIEGGRVQVNGQVVSTLGAKADPARDHIRVDGKLLHGAERHRYFMLNKPKGFVTTVSDPEGRPTVMEFFRKMPERLYPVGRLDYLSEGLLLVTNDGELANRLTRAATGVEKTYLVKIAGQPTQDELDRLSEGVAIDRGKPGEGRVHTAPASIRQVRRGDNPWYEVVLIEGRNRELRKMFEEIGHFVEKIRRVGYGPLVLDIEPGKLRELDQEELDSLRLVAEGKKRAPKAADVRRRASAEDASLPPAKSKARRDAQPPKAKPFAEKPYKSGGRAKPFGDKPSGRPAKPYREAAAQDRPRTGEYRDRGSDRGASKTGESGRGEFRPRKTFGKPQGPGRPFRPRQQEEFHESERPARRPLPREEGEGQFTPRPPRPGWQKRERPERFDTGESRRPEFRSRPAAPGAGRGAERRPPSDRFAGGDFPRERPGQGRSGGERRGDFRSTGRSQGTGPRFRNEPRNESRGERRGESGGEFRGKSAFRPKSAPRFSNAPASSERPARPAEPRTEEPGGSRPRGGAKFAGTSRGPARRAPGEGSGERPRYGAGKPSSGPRGGGRPGNRPGNRPGSRPSGPGRGRPSGPKRPGAGGKRRG